MFCSKCGGALAPHTAFCQSCGTAVNQGAVSAPVAAAYAPPAVYPATVSSVSPHWLPPPTRSYAGFWLRFAAHLIDGLILNIAFSALAVPLFVFGGFGAAIRGLPPDHVPDPAAIAALLSSLWLLVGGTFLISWLYYAYFESSDWQATLGKKVLNLVVTDLAGNRISFGRASARFFAKIISSLTLAIGYIIAGFTEKKQALHDIIAECLVLRS
jgi:uncharacterized RDD family membrane protein YckC